MKLKWTLTLLLLLALVPLGACRRTTEPQPGAGQTPSPVETGTPEPSAETTSARIYLVRGEKLGVAGRTVRASDQPAALAALALDQLVQGPTSEDEAAGLDTTVPDGTKFIGVAVEDGLATVNLSKEFESGGGSLSMLLRVAQVVYTVTQFEGIDRVAFLIEDEPVKAIGGEGIVVDPPVDRADFEGQAPMILVESPVPGQKLTSPFTASGSSNVFEATHQLQLIDSSGKVVAESVVTATSGTGTRGTWSQELEYFVESEGPGKLRAFEYSAEDGSETNVVEIPVVLGK